MCTNKRYFLIGLPSVGLVSDSLEGILSMETSFQITAVIFLSICLSICFILFNACDIEYLLCAGTEFRHRVYFIEQNRQNFCAVGNFIFVGSQRAIVTGFFVPLKDIEIL